MLLMAKAAKALGTTVMVLPLAPMCAYHVLPQALPRQAAGWCVKVGSWRTRIRWPELWPAVDMLRL